MRNILLVVCLFFVTNVLSQKNNIDNVNRVLDFIIENKDDQHIEFSGLYDKLADKILKDEEESLILVQKLKKKGFIVDTWGRGNYPPLGARIINITMIKGDCRCEIDKIYYFTTIENVFEMREGIKCSKKINP
jgi:hypothetical protein